MYKDDHHANPSVYQQEYLDSRDREEYLEATDLDREDYPDLMGHTGIEIEDEELALEA